MRTIKKAQEGFLVIAAVVLIAIFGIIGVIATYLINNNILSGANHLGTEQALYIADAGLESALHQMSTNAVTCANITGNVNLTNATFTGAAGSFTVTTVGAQSPTATTLSANINAVTTTIPVNSTATYPATGRIMIDKELIDYSGISGNN